MAESQRAALRLNDQRAVFPNARYVPKELRSKVHRFAITHLTARHRCHQVPVHDAVALGNFHVSVEVPGSIRSLLIARTEHVPGVVGLTVQCLGNLQTSIADPGRARVLQRARNAKSVPEADGRAIRLPKLHHMHRPTVGGPRNVDLCKEPILMNEKDFGMIELDMRHGVRPLGLDRAYHRGDRPNG